MQDVQRALQFPGVLTPAHLIIFTIISQLGGLGVCTKLEAFLPPMQHGYASSRHSQHFLASCSARQQFLRGSDFAVGTSDPGGFMKTVAARASTVVSSQKEMAVGFCHQMANGIHSKTPEASSMWTVLRCLNAPSTREPPFCRLLHALAAGRSHRNVTEPIPHCYN
jgi:hypothetical protein